MIDTSEIADIVSDIDAYPQIRSWFPAAQLRSIYSTSTDTPGARQVRPLGRCAFTLKADDIRSRLMPLYNRLSGEGKCKVYVVGSLSGGTGSGMFLDLAYRLRNWMAGSADIYGFLVLPDLKANRPIRYLVNVYVALLELNYFGIRETSVRGERRTISFHLPLERPIERVAPFDNCYLVSPTNENSIELHLNALPDLIAHRIYLNFDSSFSDDAARLLNNGSTSAAIRWRIPLPVAGIRATSSPLACRSFSTRPKRSRKSSDTCSDAIRQRLDPTAGSCR